MGGVSLCFDIVLLIETLLMCACFFPQVAYVLGMLTIGDFLITALTGDELTGGVEVLAPDRVFLAPDEVLLALDEVLLVPDEVLLVPNEVLLAPDGVLLAQEDFSSTPI